MHTQHRDGIDFRPPRRSDLDGVGAQLDAESWTRIDALQHVLFAYLPCLASPIGVGRLRRGGASASILCIVARPYAHEVERLLVAELAAVARAAGIVNVTTAIQVIAGSSLSGAAPLPTT